MLMIFSFELFIDIFCTFSDGISRIKTISLKFTTFSVINMQIFLLIMDRDSLKKHIKTRVVNFDRICHWKLQMTTPSIVPKRILLEILV